MSKTESVAQEIIEVNNLLKSRVQVEKHNPEDGAVINIGLNRLANLAAEAEKLLKAKEQGKPGHPGRMDTSSAEIPQA